MLCITSLGIFSERLLSFGATQSSICYGLVKNLVLLNKQLDFMERRQVGIDIRFWD